MKQSGGVYSSIGFASSSIVNAKITVRNNTNYCTKLLTKEVSNSWRTFPDK